MSDINIMWVNRIVALIFFSVLIFICEKFKLPPSVCFIVSCFYIIGMSFVFEIIKAVLK